MTPSQFLSHLLRHAWLWPLEFWLRPVTIKRRINADNQWAELFAALLGGSLWGALIGTVLWLGNGDVNSIWIMMMVVAFAFAFAFVVAVVVAGAFAFAGAGAGAGVGVVAVVVAVVVAGTGADAGAYLLFMGTLGIFLGLWLNLTTLSYLLATIDILTLLLFLIWRLAKSGSWLEQGSKTGLAMTWVIGFPLVGFAFFSSVPIEQTHLWGITLVISLGMEIITGFVNEWSNNRLTGQANFLQIFYLLFLLLALGTTLGTLDPSSLSEKLKILSIYFAIAPFIWTGFFFYPFTALIAFWQYRESQVHSFTEEGFQLTIPFRWQTFAYPLPKLSSYLVNLAKQHDVKTALTAIRILQDWTLQGHASTQAAKQLATHPDTAVVFCGEIAIQTNSATLLPFSLTGEIGRAVAVLTKLQEKEDEQPLVILVDNFPKEETSPQKTLLGNLGFKSQQLEWLAPFKATRQAPLSARIDYAQQQLQACTHYQGYDNFQSFLTLLKHYAQVQTVDEILALPALSSDKIATFATTWLAGGSQILQDLAPVVRGLTDYTQLQTLEARREVLKKQKAVLDSLWVQWQWQKKEGLSAYWQAIGQELVTHWQTVLDQEAAQAKDQLRLTLNFPQTSLLVGRQTVTVRVQNISTVIAKSICVEVQDTDGIFWTSKQVRHPLLEGNRQTELRLEYQIDQAQRYVIRGELQAFNYSTDRVFKQPFSCDLTVAEAGHAYQELDYQPYETGAGINADRTFVGRGDLLAWLLNRWRQPDSKPTLVLIGQRRIGKTSLLHKIQRAVADPVPLMPLFIDVQGITSEYDFLTTTSQKMAAALSLTPPSLDRQEPYVDFKQFLASLTTPLAGRRVLLLLDEAEKIPAGRLGDRLPDFLRSMMQGHEYPILLLFCGTHALQRTAWDYSSILFNTAQFKTVSYLSKGESQELLQKPAKDLLEFDPYVLETAYTWTRGQPLLLQSIGANVIDQFNHTFRSGKPRSNYVNYNDFEQAVDTLVKGEDNAAFKDHWKNNDAATHRVLSTLAWCLDDAYPQIDFEGLLRKMTEARLELPQRKQVADIVQRLVEEEILDKMELTYRFSVPLYRRWIAWRWDIRRVKEEGI